MRLQKNSILATGFLLLTTPFLSGQLIIDEFLVETIEITATNGQTNSVTSDINIEEQSSSRQITVEATDDFFISSEVTGNVLLTDGTNHTSGSGNMQVDYFDFILNLGDHHHFEMEFSKIVDTVDIVVELLNTSASTTLSHVGSVTGNETPGLFSFDITEQDGYTPAFLDGLNSITIVMGGGAGEFFF